MVSDWKEFLEEQKGNEDGFSGEPAIIKKDLEEFFLGEVARIEKEIKKCALNGEIYYCDYLEGQLFYVKKLAGVEKNGL